MHLLGRDERKTLGQIEGHLVSENRDRARSGPVVLADALVENAAEKVVILLHRQTLGSGALVIPDM